MFCYKCIGPIGIGPFNGCKFFQLIFSLFHLNHFIFFSKFGFWWASIWWFMWCPMRFPSSMCCSMCCPMQFPSSKCCSMCCSMCCPMQFPSSKCCSICCSMRWFRWFTIRRFTIGIWR